MGVVVPGGPFVKRVSVVASREDRGQAAPATVNHMPFCGEGEGRHAQAGPFG
jgi:hypothetical protein